VKTVSDKIVRHSLTCRN